MCRLISAVPYTWLVQDHYNESSKANRFPIREGHFQRPSDGQKYLKQILIVTNENLVKTRWQVV